MNASASTGSMAEPHMPICRNRETFGLQRRRFGTESNAMATRSGASDDSFCEELASPPAVAKAQSSHRSTDSYGSDDSEIEWSDEVISTWSQHSISRSRSAIQPSPQRKSEFTDVEQPMMKMPSIPDITVQRCYSVASSASSAEGDGGVLRRSSNSSDTPMSKTSSIGHRISGTTPQGSNSKLASGTASGASFASVYSGSSGNDHGGTIKPEMVRPEMVRGVRLSSMLFWTVALASSLWTQGMGGLDDGQARSLWALSKQVKDIDAFLSHTWQDSGVNKYMHLLLHTGWLPGAIGSLVALVLLVTLDLMQPFGGAGGKAGQDVQASEWFLVLPLMAGVLSLCLSPLILNLASKTPTVFMDAVCINQSDEVQKLAGIMSLEGILKASKSFHMILTPAYLSRLWCVFEIAAFLRLHPHGEVVLRAPMFDSILALLAMLSWFGSLTYLLLLHAFNSEVLAVFAVVVLVCVVFHSLRCSMCQNQALHDQLSSFNALKGECEEAADRILIVKSIRTWFGSTAAFNTFVQHKVGPQMEQLIEKNVSIGHGQALLCCSLAPCCLEVGSLVRFAHFHSLDAEMFCRIFYAAATIVFFIPVAARMMLGLAHRLPTTLDLSSSVNFAVSCAAATVLSLALYLVEWLTTCMCQASVLSAGIAFLIHVCVAKATLWEYHSEPVKTHSS
eukprot:TRINITY_DN12069_c0_g2_i1.p1 TRINITY_DN12069_c0_g2~~TRINITY_DN12069_c0_g2_i1.p1  ORF type:complete len:676 (-),score=88.84 TRINITY_DN12069_c0_g2_i1:293-2320(-)